MNRRELLKKFGFGAAAATVASPADLKAELAKPVVGSGPIGDLPTPVCGTNETGVNAWELSERLFERTELERNSPEFMHPNIRGKKSWSDSFKAHVHAKGVSLQREISRKIRDDKAFFEAVKKMMGM